MIFLALLGAPNTPKAETDTTARMLQHSTNLSVTVRMRMDSLGGVLSSLTRPNRLKHTEKGTRIRMVNTLNDEDLSFLGRSMIPRLQISPIKLS